MIVAELLTRLGFKVDQKGLDQGKTQLQEFKAFAAKLAIGAAVMAFGKAAFGAAAELESMQTQFTVMLKSQEASVALMKTMKDYAKLSSFETPDVARVTMGMIQYGMSQEQAIANMKRMGDVAGADNQRFILLSAALSKISSIGRLQGDTLDQLTTSGWNPLNAIAERTHKSMETLRKEMEQGKLSYKMVEQALIDVTSKGGMFYQNQLNQAKTLGGLWSTMVDNIKTKMAEMAFAVTPLAKTLMNFVGEMDLSIVVEAFSLLSDSIQYVAKIAWESGLHTAFIMIRDSVVETFDMFRSGDSATGGLAAKLKLLGQILGGLGVIIAMAASTLVMFYRWTWQVIFAVTQAAMFIWEFGKVVWGVIKDLYSLGAAVFSFFNSLHEFLLSLVFDSKIVQWILGKIAEGFTWVGETVLAFVGWVGKAFTYLYTQFMRLNDWLVASLAPLDKSAASIGDSIKAAMDKAMKYIQPVIDGIAELYNKLMKVMNLGGLLEGDGELKVKLAAVKKQAAAVIGPGMDVPVGESATLAMIRQGSVNPAKVKDAKSETKIVNNNIKFDTSVQTQVTPDGKAVLGAGDLAKMAEMTFRSSFSLELRRILAAGA